MIIEIEPQRILASCPPKWWLYYKEDNELYFHKICLTYDKLKIFSEQYGYETNNIESLKNLVFLLKILNKILNCNKVL